MRLRDFIFSLGIIVGLGGCLSDRPSGDNNHASTVNARSHVAWTGTYQGIFPCADCEGIATMLMINPDMSYALRTRKLGKQNIDKKSNGSFIWLPDNSHIRLLGKDQKQVFRVGNGFLEMTMPDDRPIEKNEKRNFYLEKSN